MSWKHPRLMRAVQEVSSPLAHCIQLGMSIKARRITSTGIGGLAVRGQGDMPRLLCAMCRADVLRRAIWELPAKPESPGRGKGKAPALSVQMWHPATPELAPNNLPWETFVTISSLPHIPVRSVSKANACQSHREVDLLIRGHNPSDSTIARTQATSNHFVVQ